jgi:hypothetical protein
MNPFAMWVQREDIPEPVVCSYYDNVVDALNAVAKLPPFHHFDIHFRESHSPIYDGNTDADGKLVFRCAPPTMYQRARK